MSLSEKRLAEIRERLTPLIFDTTDPASDLLDVASMADDLLAEVERLRAGIADAQNVRHLDHDCAACEMRAVLHALLNPAEGDDAS